jgi:uncharacterized protein (DUF2267 family)
MDYDKLLKEIQRAGDFRDRAHARDATEAVLSVLGEHLVGGSPHNLAAQLPPELGDALPLRGRGEALSIEEFELRVIERENRGCSLAEAHRHAAAVMTTVLTAIDAGEARKIAAQLPREYADLLPISPGTDR